jgi:hypothetical protein
MCQCDANLGINALSMVSNLAEAYPYKNFHFPTQLSTVFSFGAYIKEQPKCQDSRQQIPDHQPLPIRYLSYEAPKMVTIIWGEFVGQKTCCISVKSAVENKAFGSFFNIALAIFCFYSGIVINGLEHMISGFKFFAHFTRIFIECKSVIFTGFRNGIPVGFTLMFIDKFIFGCAGFKAIICCP